MASPLTVKRNDYHVNKKSSTIYTPTGVSTFLFDLLHNKSRFERSGPCGGGGRCQANFHNILDPAIGEGSLTHKWAWAGRHIIGVDIADAPMECNDFIKGKFEDIEDWPFVRPDLVLCNPPFNGAPGKRLYPEVFMDHVFHLFGRNQPLVLFTSMGMRLNQRQKSKRFRSMRDNESRLTSIISLPLDIFPDVEFHAEILIFNVKGLNAHYFLPESALDIKNKKLDNEDS